MSHRSSAQDDALVAAARSGDRRALDELARRHLPMVYHLVRQAIRHDSDVDDVVQDVMVRVLRQLPDLRSVGSFRPWLAAIAVRQVGSHQAREQVTRPRTTWLSAAADVPDASSEIEGPALLRAELATQRRQVGHAVGWMTAEERTLYSLWWLETVGELTRSEGTALFRRDATFCARDGFVAGTVSLESVNYPGFFLRRVGDQMWLDQFDGTADFRADSSFFVRAPLS